MHEEMLGYVCSKVRIVEENISSREGIGVNIFPVLKKKFCLRHVYDRGGRIHLIYYVDDMTENPLF